MTGERNLWLMQVAARAKHVASAQRVSAFLHQIAAQQGWRDRDFSAEIERAIARAYGLAPVAPASVVTAAAPHASLPVHKRPSWPEFDPQQAEVYAQHEILFELSVKKINPTDVLDQLYTDDELLCLARDVRSASTMPRQNWRGMEAAMQFIVANPMTAPIGRTLDGKRSPRCLEIATRARRFQVVEFDRGTPHAQAAILSSLHTPETVPLIMALWSGGKSMHGWFDVRALSEAAKQDFFAWAVTLGADASLWDPCKLVRMPGGRRCNAKPQPILHFKPQCLLT